MFFSHAGLPLITLDVKNLGYIWQVSDMSGRFSLACSEVCFIPHDKVMMPVPVQINSLVVTVLQSAATAPLCQGKVTSILLSAAFKSSFPVCVRPSSLLCCLYAISNHLSARLLNGILHPQDSWHQRSLL